MAATGRRGPSHRGAATPGCFLPDEILIEVFLRLPHAYALLRCSLASKRHLGLMNDPDFLRRFRNHHPGPPPLLGCFDKCRPGCYNKWRRIVSFYRFKGLDADLHHAAFAVQDCFPAEGGVSDWPPGWLIADVTDNFILVRLARAKALAVVDPLSPHRSVKFAYQRTCEQQTFYFKLLLQSEDAGMPPSFQVAFVESDGSIFVYSSETRIWQILPIDKSLNLRCQRESCSKIGHSSLYWPHRMENYGDGFLVVVNTRLMRCSIVELPPGVKYDESYSLEETEDNGLSLARLKNMVIRIWLRQNDGVGCESWALSHTIKVRDLYAMNHMTLSSADATADVCKLRQGCLFFRVHQNFRKQLMSLTINTMKLVEHARRGGSPQPYAMPWPPTFPQL